MRNAVSVLPEPVGAASRVSRRVRIAGQPGGLRVGRSVEARMEPIPHQRVEVGRRIGWVGCGGGHMFGSLAYPVGVLE